VPKVSLKFDQLSFWQKPRVLCLTASGFSPQLITLVESLSSLAKKHEIPIDKRPFTPHITLVKKAKGIVAKEFDPILLQSDSFCLVESCSNTTGVEYRIIDQWQAI
jgi:2'-5' RNA ligase